MTDRDPDSGQFAEPAFGQAGLERDAGYVPLKENEGGEDADELTEREAAEALTDQHGGTPEGEIKTYSGVAELDNNVTLTVDQAAKIVKDDRDADGLADKAAEAERIRKEVDELRGEKTEKAEALPAEEQPPRDPSNAEIDPEIEKALTNPRIAEAISKQIGEAESSRQHYAAGLEAATTIAQNAFISSFPEFANVPPEQRDAVIAGLQQHNPARFAQLFQIVQSTQGLFEAQAQEQRRQAESKRADFTKYAQQEDAKFADMVKGDEKQMPAIQKEIIEAVREYGHDPKVFFERYATDPILRDAGMQRMMVDAAKYRMLMRVPKAVASRAPVPQVQRPGVAGPRGAARGEDLRSLNQRLTESGNIKDAVALYSARQKARG